MRSTIQETCQRAFLTWFIHNNKKEKRKKEEEEYFIAASALVLFDNILCKAALKRIYYISLLVGVFCRRYTTKEITICVYNTTCVSIVYYTPNTHIHPKKTCAYLYQYRKK